MRCCCLTLLLLWGCSAHAVSSSRRRRLRRRKVNSTFVEVVLLTDRIAPSAVLASICVNTDAALRFHLVVPDELAEAPAHLVPPQCAGAAWRVLAESAVVQSIRESGLKLSWELAVPLSNLSVRVAAWDQSPKHNSVFNCLRFYLPRLPEFEDIDSIIFVDDDVVVQGDVARLWEYPLDKSLTAGCLNWIWNSRCGRMESSTNMSYVQVPYFGFGALPKGGGGSTLDLECTSDDQKECAPPGFFASLAERSAAIHGTTLTVDALRTKRAWNFGLNKFNMTAWRATNVTERYLEWIEANGELGWFQPTSLGYGLGIPFLTLADDVVCTDDPAAGMPVLHGLGFVEPDDLEVANVPLDSIETYYALHWNGDRKPYSEIDAIPEYANYFLAHAADIKNATSRRRPPGTSVVGNFVVWTEPRSGSEWFMNVIDQHTNVCASGEAHSTGRGWPREALLPSRLLRDDDNVLELCQPKAVCHWGVTSRLLANLLSTHGLSACDDSILPTTTSSYGAHLATLCAILERAAPEASVVDDGWDLDQVMRESFRVFIAEVLGSPSSPPLSRRRRQLQQQQQQVLVARRPPPPLKESRAMPCSCPPGTTMTGTKIMNGWLDAEHPQKYDINFVANILDDLGSKIVVLDRNNLFGAYVSLRVAELTRKFHCRGSSCRHEGRVRVDIDRLLEFIRHTLRHREKRDALLGSKKTRFEVLRIQYEFCVENKPACFRKVLGFLAVDNNDRVLETLLASDVTSRDVRTAVERVSNFDAVARALVEAGMGHYLTLDELASVANSSTTTRGVDNAMHATPDVVQDDASMPIRRRQLRAVPGPFDRRLLF
ncbi:hypothetical protein CTAYLR_003470 [Chrysophaeum taylorii]|uniref:Uncharacterized protein n=1 Tax=Chrysophaeum taylorii TaxID=2483200 RepID=A0AAD7U8D9_9STRA|nr:hypothetical protein CTAYLR_003470 [Chrysophaeum taylorii]